MRMGRLVATLLQFSRRSQPQISTIDFREELENALDLIHFRLLKHQIELSKTYQPEVPAVYADRQQMRQLFLNLYNNAIDAMLVTGGALRICVSVESSATTFPETQAEPGPQSNYVVIEITDNGSGIPGKCSPK